MWCIGIIIISNIELCQLHGWDVIYSCWKSIILVLDILIGLIHVSVWTYLMKNTHVEQ